MVALAPDDASVLTLRSRIVALGYGNTTESIRVLENLLVTSPDNEIVDALVGYFIMTGSPERAASLLNQYRQSDYFSSDSAYFY